MMWEIVSHLRMSLPEANNGGDERTSARIAVASTYRIQWTLHPVYVIWLPQSYATQSHLQIPLVWPALLKYRLSSYTVLSSPLRPVGVRSSVTSKQVVLLFVLFQVAITYFFLTIWSPFAFSTSMVPEPYKKTPRPESASELYRPSDRRLSAKLVPTLAERGCCVVSATDFHGR
jgi:hypothetical protein